MPQAATVSENNKRIAKNTLMLYVKMGVTMLVSLYTSRVVLEFLGIEDYGIYNVVGGFVALFSLISGALSVSISRFFTFELGRGNQDELRRIFSSALVIQIVLGALLFILISTVGIWFVSNKLVIPPERLGAAQIVLFLSGVSFFISLISVPYNAAIIAHERMKAFAFVGIFEAILKLFVAYSLVLTPFDKLIVYGVLTVVSSLIIRSMYAVYCKKHFSECSFRFCWDKRLFQKMFSFAGWAFLGNGSFVLKTQGVNIVINMFYGAAVNAAFGITSQVTAAVTSFVSNFMQAVNPQITKNFSSGKLPEMHSLILRSSRFSFFLMLLLCLPVIKGTDFILSTWLVEVPEHTANFVRLSFVFCLIDCLVLPVMFGLLAEGNIRNYEIFLGITNTLNLPLSYFALHVGFPPESVFVIAIIIGVVVAAGRVWLARSAFSLSSRKFLTNVLLPSTFVCTGSSIFAWVLNIPVENEILKFIFQSGLIVVVTGVLVVYFGLNREERELSRFYFSKITRGLL